MRFTALLIGRYWVGLIKEQSHLVVIILVLGYLTVGIARVLEYGWGSIGAGLLVYLIFVPLLSSSWNWFLRRLILYCQKRSDVLGNQQ